MYSRPSGRRTVARQRSIPVAKRSRFLHRRQNSICGAEGDVVRHSSPVDAVALEAAGGVVIGETVSGWTSALEPDQPWLRGGSPRTTAVKALAALSQKAIPRRGEKVVGGKSVLVRTAAAIGIPRGVGIVAIGRVDPSALEKVAVGSAIKRRAIGTGTSHTYFIRRPPTAQQSLPTGLDYGARIGNGFDTAGRSGTLARAV
jgi:hypothetical protein